MAFLLILFSYVNAVTLEEIDGNIELLENSLYKFQKARDLLLFDEQNEQRKETDIKALSEFVNKEDYLLNKLLPRGKFNSSSEVLTMEFITLRPLSSYKDIINGNNLGIVVTSKDGYIRIYDITGNLLIDYELGYQTKFIACTSNYDEMKIAVITPSHKLQVFMISMERVRQNQTDENERIPNRIDFNITKENEDDLYAGINASSMIYYVKTGKKSWVIGDEKGGLSIHSFNGTFLKRVETGFGEILSMDRFGHHLVFGCSNGIGLINSGSFEIHHFCESAKSTLVPNKITGVVIDTSVSTSIVYGATEKNEIIILDTRPNEESEELGCHIIKKFDHGYSYGNIKIKSIRGYLLALSEDGELRFYNSTGVRENEFSKTFNVTISNAYGNSLFKVSRIQNGGNLISIANKREIMVFEYVLPYKEGAGVEFGGMRYIILFVAIGGAVLWQYVKTNENDKKKHKNSDDESEIENIIRRAR
ncbi:unnamed protein product [Blepharisma stoltei]|uniref:Uncharacterized protein n=1 Tax=Blepharisma stoltei TaxID=1481888 RepID=A0AAU9IXH3_9CILI|nr:unnamed protein product [Blepharisma stoltei]